MKDGELLLRTSPRMEKYKIRVAGTATLRDLIDLLNCLDISLYVDTDVQPNRLQDFVDAHPEMVTKEDN